MNKLIAIRPMLTLEEVARLMRIHKETLRRLIRQGSSNVPPHIDLNPGGKAPRYRFTEDDVFKFMKDMKKAP